MTEDAKHAADKSAEQKSGQEQEQMNKPEEREEQNPDTTNEDKTENTKNKSAEVIDESESDDFDNVETEEKGETEEKKVENAEEKVEMDAEKSNNTDGSADSEQEESDEALGEKKTNAGMDAEKSDEKKSEPKVISSETTVLSEDPKITLTVEQTEGEETEDNNRSDIEIEIGLDKQKNENFQQSVREQIENCKFEIISSIQDSVHSELRGSDKELRRIDRRRRVGFILRDIIILILAAMLGYAIYCLYDAQYFDFMKPECAHENTCSEQSNDNKNNDVAQVPEIVKDLDWYKNNYGYLFDALQLKLNADEVGAYYLYSGDYRLNEIQPSYLLGMAYNVLNSSVTYDSSIGIAIPATDMRTAFENLFGTAEHFAKQNFTNGCVDFTYDKSSDSFITPAVQCVSNANREIVEQIDEIYEEGNAMYFLTTAAIYDKSENAFYNFDNLFKSVAQNVDKDDLGRYQASLNHYQYRFKKVDNKFYFSDIVKLK